MPQTRRRLQRSVGPEAEGWAGPHGFLRQTPGHNGTARHHHRQSSATARATFRLSCRDGKLPRHLQPVRVKVGTATLQGRMLRAVVQTVGAHHV